MAYKLDDIDSEDDEIETNQIVRKYFVKWATITSFRRYDRWCGLKEEENQEVEYSIQYNMDSIHWCWNCIHSECELHNR